MSQFSLFTALESRALTGNPLTKNAEKLALTLLREQACLANANADTVFESLAYLEIAAEHHCPYSSFVLGCIYLEPRLRKPSKEPYSPEWYNLSNGSIHQRCNPQNKSELINLTVLEQSLKPDIEKARHYFQLSANFNNPQALLWLSCLALSHSTTLSYSFDLRFAKLYAEMAIVRIPPESDRLVKQFELHEITYLCDWDPTLASALLSQAWFIQFLLEPKEPLGQDEMDTLFHLLTVNQQVAKTFLNDEQFLSHFNPYQKTEILHYVLEEFPELYNELHQAFCYKKHKH